MTLVKETAHGSGICHGMVFEQHCLGKINPFVQYIGMGGEAIGFAEVSENGKFALVADFFQRIQLNILGKVLIYILFCQKDVSLLWSVFFFYRR